MCGLCGILDADHWADAATDGPAQARRQMRLRRARLLGRLLSGQRIQVEDWQGTIVIRGATGHVELAATLGDFWAKAEQVARRPLDVLDPAFIDAVEAMADADHAR